MMENYVYPDTHEMFDLHDTLEELISKESYDIGLGLGSRVDSDPDLEYLLEVLFTPVEARCSYLDIWGARSIQISSLTLRMANLWICPWKNLRKSVRNG